MAACLERIYGHSTGRWLYNDKKQRALRYTPFDVEALKEITCQSVGAKRCVNFTKLGEGSYNKVFLLELDNGAKATARIPSTLVGNLELSTASEAATLSYLLESNIPSVPRILTWNASAEANPVKWPYIITEYVPGSPLHNNWLRMRGNPVRTVIGRLLLNEMLVSRIAFSQIGSLYFKDDVSPELQARPLFAVEEYNVDDPTDISQKYRIGPIVDREWWRGGRRGVDADRGPWPDTASFIAAAARLEQSCISEAIDFHSPYPRSSQEDIPEIHKLLDRCIAASPYLAPDDPALANPTMAHPDLSASNIIVTSEEDAKYTIIDWQGTIVAPFFMQSMIPPAIVYSDSVVELPPDGSMPSFPENMNQLPQTQQEHIRLHHTLACRHRLYILKMGEFDPRFPSAWTLPHWGVMGWLLLHICRSWALGPLDLRQDLITLEDRWPKISSSPCPLHFTAEERAKHEAEFAEHTFNKNRVELLRNVLGCDTDGWVRNEDFDEARDLMEQVKEQWNPEDEKGPFPFEEGSYSYFLT